LQIYTGFMNSKKVVKQLNSSFDEASRCVTKRNKMRESFLKEIKVAEKDLLKKLKKESQKSKKQKLEEKLRQVDSAYASLR
jgi:hypothetical protein